MGLVYAGHLPILGLCPIVNTALGNASLSVAANYHGALAVSAQYSSSPPNVPAVLAEMGQFNADVSTAIGLSLPSVSFDVSACAALTVSLNTSISTLPTLQALLNEPNTVVGIFAYAYAGNGNALGAALTSALASTWGDGITPTSVGARVIVLGLADSLSTTQYAAFFPGLTFGGPGLVYEGQLSLGQMCGAAMPADAFAQAAPVLSSQISATASLQASLAITPPTLTATLAASIAAAADLAALPPPAVTIAASAAFAANIQATSPALIALGDIVSRNDAQAFVYLYTGAASSLGAAVTTALSSTWGDGHTSSAGACTAIVLGVIDAGPSAAALTTFFGGA